MKEEKKIHCGEEVVDNLYHRAKDKGAIWYCNKCKEHLDKNLKIIPKYTLLD